MQRGETRSWRRYNGAAILVVVGENDARGAVNLRQEKGKNFYLKILGSFGRGSASLSSSSAQQLCQSFGYCFSLGEFDEADTLLCGSSQNKVIHLINSFHFDEKLWFKEFVDAVRHARGSGQPVFSKKEASAISSRRGVLIKSQSTTSVNAITRSKP
ncbi:hypothetical protein VNO77_02197 [Canavalia gladiata]|uniref:Uncharacterized protein n=1 Tax=Canavalia gladiata TaxID=3824 RepID=A0AAN9R2U1_CANGL